MPRKYDEQLLTLLKERTVEDSYMGAPLLIKRVPDNDEEGIMDTRLYNDMKGQLKLLRFMPAKAMKMDTSEKGLVKLRKMFNGIKSVPVCTLDIERTKYLITTLDGMAINLYHYKQAKTNLNSPVLFYIHGGGFFAGHHGVVEESMKLMCEKYAFNIFSVDYRLAPEYPYPLGHQDCFEALNWVYDHAEELKINKELIFVGGDSAGGNLAQYCSTRDVEEGKNIIKGQILLYPTLNMAGIEDEYFHWDINHFKMASSQKKALTKMLTMFEGMTEGMQDILKTQDISNDYLNPYTRNPQKNPPTFISAGEHDYLKEESIAYAAKLYAAGIKVRTVIYNGMGHAYLDNTGVYPQCEDCIDEMAQFIIDFSK